MGTLNFSDGVSVKTDGPLRILRLSDGWYVVGEGMLYPAHDLADAEEILETNLFAIERGHKIRSERGQS